VKEAMSTKIEYADETLNPFAGCSPCSPGCLNCYASRAACGRFLKNHPLYKGLAVNGKWTGEIRTCFDIDRPDILDKPLHWKKPRRIFIGNMGDLFHPKIDIGFLTHVFDVIEQCPQHKFLILTKRPSQALRMMWGKHGKGWRYFGKNDYHANIHFGATICNQAEQNKNALILSAIPAARKWHSYEPLLGPIDIVSGMDMLPDWVAVGCESGPNRRPCKLDWMIDVVEQCQAAGVPVFVKQVPINGQVSHDMSEWPEKLRIRNRV